MEKARVTGLGGGHCNRVSVHLSCQVVKTKPKRPAAFRLPEENCIPSSSYTSTDFFACQRNIAFLHLHTRPRTSTDLALHIHGAACLHLHTRLRIYICSYPFTSTDLHLFMSSHMHGSTSLHVHSHPRICISSFQFTSTDLYSFIPMHIHRS